MSYSNYQQTKHILDGNVDQDLDQQVTPDTMPCLYQNALRTCGWSESYALKLRQGSGYLHPSPRLPPLRFGWWKIPCRHRLGWWSSALTSVICCGLWHNGWHHGGTMIRSITWDITPCINQKTRLRPEVASWNMFNMIRSSAFHSLFFIDIPGCSLPWVSAPFNHLTLGGPTRNPATAHGFWDHPVCAGNSPRDASWRNLYVDQTTPKCWGLNKQHVYLDQIQIMTYSIIGLV